MKTIFTALFMMLWCNFSIAQYFENINFHVEDSTSTHCMMFSDTIDFSNVTEFTLHFQVQTNATFFNLSFGGADSAECAGGYILGSIEDNTYDIYVINETVDTTISISLPYDFEYQGIYDYDLYQLGFYAVTTNKTNVYANITCTLYYNLDSTITTNTVQPQPLIIHNSTKIITMYNMQGQQINKIIPYQPYIILYDNGIREKRVMLQ